MRTAKRTGIAALFAVFFALLLAGCLCLGLPAKREAQAAEGLPSGAPAGTVAGVVQTPGDKEVFYTTVDGAFDAANHGATINIYSNVSDTEDSVYRAGLAWLYAKNKSLTVNGNGHTLTATSVSYPLYYRNSYEGTEDSYKLVINDLTIVGKDNAVYGIFLYGERLALELNNSTLDTSESTQTYPNNPSALCISGRADETVNVTDAKDVMVDVHISGSTLKTSSSGRVIKAENPVKLTIDEKSTLSGWSAIYMRPLISATEEGAIPNRGTEYSTITISDSTISTKSVHNGGNNMFGVIVFENGKITLDIQDSDIVAETTGTAQQYVIYYSGYYKGSDPDTNNVNFNNTDVTLTGSAMGFVGSDSGLTASDLNVKASGGAFNFEVPEGYLAEGMTVYEVDGKYLVGDQTAVAFVMETSKGYTSLQEALNAAPDKGTVTLLADTDATVVYEGSSDITLELNGHKLGGAFTWKPSKQRTLDIYGGTATSEGNGTFAAALNVEKLSRVNFRSGTFEGKITSNGGSLYFYGGTFTGAIEKTLAQGVVQGVVYIYGGKFSSTFTVDAGTFSIYSGTFESGVTFTGEKTPSVSIAKNYDCEPPKFANTIEESSFKLDTAKYERVDSTDGYYTIREIMYFEVNGKQFQSFNDALNAAEESGTIKLLRNIEGSSRYTIDKSITLDLGGNTVTSSNTGGAFNVGKYGEEIEVTITNGTIVATANTSDNGGHGAIDVSNKATLMLQKVSVTGVYFGVRVGTPDKSSASGVGHLIVEEGTTIENAAAAVKSEDNAETRFAAIGVYGRGGTETGYVSTVTIEGGEVVGYYYGIVNNGTDDISNTKLTITGGAVENTLTNDGAAIFNPGKGEVTVSGGSITGATGIEMRAGSLTVSGEATITATGTYKETATDSGSSICGAAVALSPHVTNNQIKFDIQNGSFSGEKAFVQKTTNEAYNPSVSGTITDGKFDGDVEAESTVLKNFISNGTFSEELPVEYLAENIAQIADKDGDYIVGDYTSLAETANAVAVVKETGTAYTSLQEAITAAKDGATVTLLQNVSESVTIEKDKNITIDLNGQTLKNKEGSHTITNYGTLTITDSGENGTVDNVSHGRSAVFNEAGATAYLNNGTFTRSAEASTGFNNNGGNSYYVILNQGTMTIGTEAGTPEIRFPEGKGYYSSLVENGWYTASQNTDGVIAKLTVLNGTFVGGKHSLKNDSYGELVIENANVSGAGSCAILNWNDLTVNGGTFSGSEGAIYSAASSNDYEQGKSVITGGFFSGTLILDGAASYSISSGEFDTAFPSAYLAENAVLVKTEDGFKALDADSEAAKDYVAEVSDPAAETAVRYETLAAAITAAKDGDTVKLLANITNIEDNGRVVIKKNITLDFNGRTFTENAFVYAIVVDGATVTITSTGEKGKLEAKVNGIAIQNKADVTVSNISITSKYYGMLGETLYDGRAVQIVNSTAVFENVDATTTANGVENNAVGWVIFNSEVTIKNSDISITYTRVEDQKENDNLQGYAVFASNSNVSITGTTITSSGDKIAYGVIFYGGMSMSDAAAEETTDNFKELTIDSSTITANAFAISGNGSNGEAYPYSGTSISITGNSKLESELAAAIYHPQYGELTIDGSEITGKTGIEMRAGNLTVKGGTITATGDPFESDSNGNGSTTDGAAIAIVQHTTKQKIDVQLAGGSYKGVRAVYQANLQKNDDEAIKKIGLSITGGTYNGEVYSENLENFIEGGAFSEMPKMDYFAENYIAEYNAETGMYETTKGSWVAAIGEDGEEGYATLQDAINAAEEGDVIELLANVKLTDPLTIDKSVTIDLAGYTISAPATAANITADATIKSSVKGGTIKHTGKDPDHGLIITNDATLTLESVTVDYEGAGQAVKLGTFKDGKPTEKSGNAVLNGVTVKGGQAGVIVLGTQKDSEYGASLTVTNSNISGTIYYGIVNNGMGYNTSITLENTKVSAPEESGTAMYLPGEGETTITGGTITGATGIEIRAGKLTINEGTTITATGDYEEPVANPSGTTVGGVAVAVSQHTTQLAINVAITGGTFNATGKDGKAFLEIDTVEKEDAKPSEDVTASITGGAFDASVEARNITGFIEGGDFGVKPADELMNENYAAEYVNGRYVAVPSTALKEARLAAQADVRAYAAAKGIDWSQIEAAAEDESAVKVLAAYNAIAEAMSTLAVAEAKLDAMAAVDDYADAIEEAFAKLVAEAIKEIEKAAAASEDQTAVVVPTATYAAIYAAETKAELKYLKDNALAEIKDIRAYRGEIAAQAEKLETLAAAIAAIDGGLFGTDEGAQGAIKDIQDAIAAAQEAITGGDETTSTSLKEIYEYLDGTLKSAVDDISNMLNGAVSEGGILYEMQETLEALDATVNGDGTEGSALLDKLTAAITNAQNAINSNTATEMGEAVKDITEAITAAQEAIIAALPDYEETLGEIAGSVEALEELLGGTNGLAAIKKGIDGALTAIGTADGETLFEQLAAIESGNTAIKTTVDELAAALTGKDGAIATLTAALTAMQGDITKLTGALAEDTGWVAKDIAAAQAEIDKLTAAVGKLGTVDGKDLAAVVGEIADGLEAMDATVNSIASTVSAASAVEEAKTQAAADIRTWLEGYLEELAGDTAQADVLARAAYTAETTEGELYKDISAQFGEENGKLVLKYYNEALAAIDAATTVSDVTTAVATFRAQVASIEASAGNSTDLTVVYVLLGVVLLVLIIACIVALVKGGRQPEPAPAQAAPAEKPAETQPEEKAEEKEEQAEEAAPAEELAEETAKEATPAEEESAAAEDDDKERVVISANVRTFDEAYQDLTDEQRELFNKVKEYALAKEDAVEVKQSGGVVIKRKSKQIVKLTVRRDMPVALFLLENEMLKDFRRNAKSEAKLKVRATELVIREADDLETAYTMVDLSVEQIEKDLEAAKERRREARRQRRLQRQAEEAAAEQAEGAEERALAEEPASAESAATDGTDTE